MNDYFLTLLIFGFIFTFLTFIIISFSKSPHYFESEEQIEKKYLVDQINAFVEIIDNLRKENSQLRNKLNRYSSIDNSNGKQ